MSSLAILLALTINLIGPDPQDSSCMLAEVTEAVTVTPEPCPPDPPGDTPIWTICTDDPYEKEVHLHWIRFCGAKLYRDPTSE